MLTKAIARFCFVLKTGLGFPFGVCSPKMSSDLDEIGAVIVLLSLPPS